MNIKKLYYLISIIIVITLFSLRAISDSNLNQEAGSNGSAELGIPTCTSCNSNSEPTCSGSQSPLCSVDQNIPTCQLIGNLCNVTCPITNFAGSNSPFCSTKYFFIDGPGAGIQIYSSNENPIAISFSTNSISLANGSIKEPDQGCAGPESHFNGDILNFSDSDPDGCGWGHVTIFKKLPDRLNLLSDIITTTKHASYNIQAFVAGDYGAALIRVDSVSNSMNTLKNLIAKSKDIKPKNKKIILRLIKAILKQMQIAKLNISSLVNVQGELTQSDLLNRDSAITALSKANDSEIEILKIILKFDVIQ